MPVQNADAMSEAFARQHQQQVESLTRVIIAEYGNYSLTLLVDVLGLLILTLVKVHPGLEWETLLGDTVHVLRVNVVKQALENDV